jgi:hypothetical protein
MMTSPRVQAGSPASLVARIERMCSQRAITPTTLDRRSPIRGRLRLDATSENCVGL